MHSTSNSPIEEQARPSRAAAVDAALPHACPHCAAHLVGRYCHACGEDSLPSQTSWRAWIAQWQRVVRTIRSLWFEPGLMAIRHLHGVRIGYVPPLTLFLNAVAVFFLFSAATQFQLTSIAEQNGPWMEPIIEERMAATGRTREVVLERAERRFQGIYTLCLATVSGVGYMLVYRLLFRRSLPGWRGAFTLALYYLAFLFTLFLPWMLVITPLRERYGDGVALGIVALVLVAAAAWNSAAAKRIGAHRWPMAIAKGLAVIVAGFFIDSAMTTLAIWLSLRLA